MPGKFITRESWSRCESPSMLYDAVRRPVQKPALVSLPNGQDTIETTKRLKQERINKLENKGLELSHESYVTVVQVGKYMFFAVMLPVYLCCYGLPRWIVVKALQPLYEGVKNQAASMGRYAVELSKSVVDVMRGLLDQLIGDALRMSKQRGKNLFQHILRRFRNVSDKFSNASKAIKKRFKEFKDAAAKRSQNLYKKAEGRVLARNALMKQKAFGKAKQAGAWVLKVLTKLDEMFLTPILKVVFYPFRLLFKVLGAIKNFLLKILQQVRDRLKKIIDPWKASLKRLIAAFYAQCKKRLAIMFQPLLKGITAVKIALKGYFQKVRKTLMDPVVVFGAKVSLKVKEITKAAINRAKPVFSALAPLLKPVINLVKEKIGHCKKPFSQFGHKVKQIAHELASIAILVIKFCKKCAKKGSEEIFNMMSFWWGKVKSQVHAAISFPKRAVLSIASSAKFLAFIVSKVVFTMQIVATIIGMAFTGGFELVKETVESN